MSFLVKTTVVISKLSQNINKFRASLVIQMVNVCLQCGWPGFDPWLGMIPWRRKWWPTPVLLPREFHGWRSLVGYSLWDRKESDTTQQLHFTSSKKFNVKWIDTHFSKTSMNISDFLIPFLPHMHPHHTHISYLL